MDTRKDRGDFYPGGETGGSAPAPQPSDKVDRVNLGELGENYTLEKVKAKVDQIVRVIAPAAVCLALAVVRLLSYAATAPLEEIPNTSPVVTNEEDAVAMAAVGRLGAAVSNRVDEAESQAAQNLASATNSVMGRMAEIRASESNRVEATYAKRSEIPTAPDLSPYALKSELPRDYVTEGDITNFATRAWINSQGYAREGTVYAWIDAQNLALGAATNEVWQAMKSGTNKLWEAHGAASNRLNMATNALWNAHRAEVSELRATDTALSNRLNTATNALWNAHRAEVSELGAMDAALSNRLDAATNKLWQAARSESNRLERTAAEIRDEIAALELTGGMTRLWTSDAKTYQDATGVVWQVQVATSAWTVVHTWTTNDVNWVGPFWWGEEGAGEDYYEGPGWYIASSSLTTMKMSEDIYESQIVMDWTYWGEEAHSITTTCSRTVQWLTNAVERVQYRGDVAAASNALALALSEMEGRLSVAIESKASMSRVEEAAHAATNYANQVARDSTNYTDAVAGEFSDGSRTVGYSDTSGFANTAGSLIGDGTAYNASDLIRESTNAAIAVAASKQDALPYPTNAIPYAAISGAPSGGQEWRVVNYDVEVDAISFVTNGMAILTFINAGYAYGINVSTSGWPEGASMFVRGSFRAGATYTIPYDLRLIGYGTWPTNNFQSVWWRSGTNIYVNVILEE